MPLRGSIIEFAPSIGSITLHDACVLISASEHAGVKSAARNLANDLSLVTGNDIPSRVLDNDEKKTTCGHAIIIGSLDASALLKRLVDKGNVAIDRVAGKWEAFQTCVVDEAPPWLGVDAALVIAGSDKRGAIFGAYTLSEQAGVSP